AARLTKDAYARCAGSLSGSRASGFASGSAEATEILCTKRMWRSIPLEEEAALLQRAVRPVPAHRTVQGQTRRTDQTAPARTVCGSHAKEARAAFEGGEPFDTAAPVGR